MPHGVQVAQVQVAQVQVAQVQVAQVGKPASSDGTSGASVVNRFSTGSR